MSLLNKIRALDPITKIGIIILVMIGAYIGFLFLLKPVFIPAGTLGTHDTVMGDHIMSFVSPAQRNLNLTSIFLAFIAGFGAWLLIKGENANKTSPETKPGIRDEIEILKKALNPDEKLILEEIQKAGEITQDSLRFRLNWSKAKVSAILLQLDRMGLVQRERQGKTYKVFIQKKE